MDALLGLAMVKMYLSHRTSQPLTNAGSVFRLGHPVGAEINALVAATGVLAVLVWSAHVLATFVHIFTGEQRARRLRR